jgi:hypothetical protein
LAATRRPDGCRLRHKEGTFVTTPANWPITGTLAPVHIAAVGRTGGHTQQVPGGCVRELHQVVVELDAADKRVTVTVTDVEIPDPFHHQVADNPQAALPFVIAKVTEPPLDALARLDAAAKLIEANSELHPSVRVDTSNLVFNIRDLQRAYSEHADVAAAVRSHYPELDGLSYLELVAKAWSQATADALELLEQVRFDVEVTRTADSYGDTSRATVRARHGERQVTYTLTGGVMAPGIYQAAKRLHEAAVDGDQLAADLLGDNGAATVAALTWVQH